MIRLSRQGEKDTMEQGAETRDEVMGTGDLFKLLCDRTAREYRARWQQSHVRPPIGLVCGTGIVGVVLAVVGMQAYLVFVALSVLLLVWYLVVTLLQSRDHVEERARDIEEGRFPAESVELVMPRLRWWNHLVVPQQWSKHSRIFEQERRLEERRGQVQARVDFLETPEGKAELEEAEQAAKAKEGAAKGKDTEKGAPSPSRMMQMIRNAARDGASAKPEKPVVQAADRDGAEAGGEESGDGARLFDNPEELAERLLNVKQRAYHVERISNIKDEKLRLGQELVFLDALLLKVYAVTHTLGEIEKLEPKVEGGTVENPTALFLECVTILEHRRQLVMKVDRIRPGDLMQLVSF